MPKDYSLDVTPANEQRRPKNAMSDAWVKDFLRRARNRPRRHALGRSALHHADIILVRRSAARDHLSLQHRRSHPR